MKSLSHVRLFATPWTVAYQAAPSMGFSRQGYWSRLPFPSPGDLRNPGIESRSPTLQADTFTIWDTREVPRIDKMIINRKLKIPWGWCVLDKHIGLSRPQNYKISCKSSQWLVTGQLLRQRKGIQQKCIGAYSVIAQLVKNPPAMQETPVGFLSQEDLPGKGIGYPLQYSGLENSMDCIFHGVAKNQTWLSDFHCHCTRQYFGTDDTAVSLLTEFLPTHCSSLVRVKCKGVNNDNIP